MSLRFDYTQCEPTTDERQLALRQHMMWICMHVGIGEVTEANAGEFWQRVRFIERLDGPYLHDEDGKPTPMTLDDVRGCIGYTTNVFPKETKAKFLARQWDMHTRYDARV